MAEVATPNAAPNPDNAAPAAPPATPPAQDPPKSSADPSGSTPTAVVPPVKDPVPPKEPDLLIDKKGDEDKKPLAPEKYDAFKLPEGVTLTDEETAKIVETAKALDLTQEQAQKYAEMAISAVAQARTDHQAALERQDTAWIEQVKADAEIGGAKFDESITIANKAFKQFSTPEVKKILVDTRMGNHPAMVKMFYNIGKALGEPTMHGGKGNPEPKSVTSILYDKMETNQ